MTREQERVLELLDEQLHLLERGYGNAEKGAGAPQDPPTKTDLQNREKLARLRSVLREFAKARDLLGAYYETQAKRVGGGLPLLDVHPGHVRAAPDIQVLRFEDVLLPAVLNSRGLFGPEEVFEDGDAVIRIGLAEGGLGGPIVIGINRVNNPEDFIAFERAFEDLLDVPLQRVAGPGDIGARRRDDPKEGLLSRPHAGAHGID